MVSKVTHLSSPSSSTLSLIASLTNLLHLSFCMAHLYHTVSVKTLCTLSWPRFSEGALSTLFSSKSGLGFSMIYRYTYSFFDLGILHKTVYLLDTYSVSCKCAYCSTCISPVLGPNDGCKLSRDLSAFDWALRPLSLVANYCWKSLKPDILITSGPLTASDYSTNHHCCT